MDNKIALQLATLCLCYIYVYDYAEPKEEWSRSCYYVFLSSLWSLQRLHSWHHVRITDILQHQNVKG